ncbi:putative zinc-binding dehydrogenase [Diaporthe ampelina]|uniref:Putative zinc-binding dehydrogenase n=1 Tax=Diaporthe ampelina TaxID=1214573 RepID=A0A0G2FW98_9PEZI|nr:putative zinc-binding dehydrogenase [Diaporthe ampelina]
MSGCFAGTVVQLGDPKDPSLSESSKTLGVGDKVFGFTFQQQQHRPMQTYITVPVTFLGKIPPNVSAQEAVTIPSNFCTAIHTITRDLGLELPWPVPEYWASPEADKPILVWGAAGSVGQYTVQVLKHWGYRNVLAVASAKHHDSLKQLGATAVFDYNNEDAVKSLSLGPHIPYIIDCIGSLEGTVTPLSKIAGKGTKVAIMLPVVVSHASDTDVPTYEMDVGNVLVGQWKEGVEVRGVRTHFYQDNEFYKYHLQPDIMPALLRDGLIRPNKQRLLEGGTLLQRAEQALSLFREGSVSGEKVVWRVAEG